MPKKLATILDISIEKKPKKSNLVFEISIEKDKSTKEAINNYLNREKSNG